jgi:replication factor A1
LKKRELTLVDSTGYQVKLTLWGRTAESFEHYDAPVVAFKGVKVGDYGGKSIILIIRTFLIHDEFLFHDS